MTLDDFRGSLAAGAPPPGTPPALAALWWDAKQDWNKAHECVAEATGRDAAWVHAFLHRKEGDPGNARYWYRQAERTPSAEPPSAEWTTIATALLARAD